MACLETFFPALTTHFFLSFYQTSHLHHVVDGVASFNFFFYIFGSARLRKIYRAWFRFLPPYTQEK